MPGVQGDPGDPGVQGPVGDLGLQGPPGGNIDTFCGEGSLLWGIFPIPFCGEGSLSGTINQMDYTSVNGSLTISFPFYSDWVVTATAETFDGNPATPVIVAQYFAMVKIEVPPNAVAINVFATTCSDFSGAAKKTEPKN